MFEFLLIIRVSFLGDRKTTYDPLKMARGNELAWFLEEELKSTWARIFLPIVDGACKAVPTICLKQLHGRERICGWSSQIRRHHSNEKKASFNKMSFCHQEEIKRRRKKLFIHSGYEVKRRQKSPKLLKPAYTQFQRLCLFFLVWSLEYQKEKLKKNVSVLLIHHSLRNRVIDKITWSCVSWPSALSLRTPVVMSWRSSRPEVRRPASGWGSLWESSSFVPWFILNTFRNVSRVVKEWPWRSGFMRKTSSRASAPSMRFSVLLNSCDNFLATIPSISSKPWEM